MSDLTLTLLISTVLVIGTILILGYLVGRSEKHDVQKLLPLIKCVCGYSPLDWTGSWGIDYHSDFTSDDPVDGPTEARDIGGYTFECSACGRSLWFTFDGRMHSIENDEPCTISEDRE